MIGHEETFSSCARGGLDWTLGRISSWPVLSKIGMSFSGSGGDLIPGGT